MQSVLALSETVETGAAGYEPSMQRPDEKNEGQNCKRCGACCKPHNRHRIRLSKLDILKLKIMYALELEGKFGLPEYEKLVVKHEWEPGDTVLSIVKNINHHGAYCSVLEWRTDEDGIDYGHCRLHESIFRPSMCGRYRDYENCMHRDLELYAEEAGRLGLDLSGWAIPGYKACSIEAATHG